MAIDAARLASVHPAPSGTFAGKFFVVGSAYDANARGVKDTYLHRDGKWRPSADGDVKNSFTGYFDTREEASNTLAVALMSGMP